MTRNDSLQMKIIARIRTDFSEKFGIPRQAGLVPELTGTIIFEPAYRNPDALRGLEGFSHLWLIWQFSEAVRADWSPTVRPPRLGGNTRMGVFATRSPYRPNAIGLSCVQLEAIRQDPQDGPVLQVRGVDMMDGTPILDIKPYLPYTDSYPQAASGFAGSTARNVLCVDFPPQLLRLVPADRQNVLIGVLAQDPRPPYQNDPTRIYGLSFGGQNIRFNVRAHILTVLSVEDLPL